MLGRCIPAASRAGLRRRKEDVDKRGWYSSTPPAREQIFLSALPVTHQGLTVVMDHLPATFASLLGHVD